MVDHFIYLFRKYTRDRYLIFLNSIRLIVYELTGGNKNTRDQYLMSLIAIEMAESMLELTGGNKDTFDQYLTSLI